MKTTHIVHVTQNGKNIRVEADTFEKAIAKLNKATKNQPYDILSMEHIAGLGE